MFDNYEPLSCVLCGIQFLGRKPVEGGDALCPICLMTDELEIITADATVPEIVDHEFTGGKGDAE